MADSNQTITRVKLIKRAFRRIGKFYPTLNIDIPNGVELLNDIVKRVDEDGRWLWTISNTPTLLNTVASQRSYTVGTAPTGIANNILKLVRFELLEGTTITPLTVVEKTEAISTTLRESTGKPTLAYLENMPAMTAQKIHLFETPNGIYNCQYYFQRRLYDFDNPADNPDFPQGWSMRLTSILAYELSKEYGTPLDERVLLQQEAQAAENSGLASNMEDPGEETQTTVYY